MAVVLILIFGLITRGVRMKGWHLKILHLTLWLKRPGLPVQNDQKQKIVGDATSSAAASAIDRKISTVTGGLVGSVVRDISNAGRSRKETYVSFFDNQKVFLRPGLPK